MVKIYLPLTLVLPLKSGSTPNILYPPKDKNNKVHRSISRGNIDWNCLPWPGKIEATCMSYLTTGGLSRNAELTSYHQLEESGKGKRKEKTPVHVSYQPPRIHLTGMYLGWAMCTPPGRTLSQNDWLQTTRKLTPRLWVTWQSSFPRFTYTAALWPGAHSQWNLLLSQHVSLLGQFFRVLEYALGTGARTPSCNISLLTAKNWK